MNSSTSLVEGLSSLGIEASDTQCEQLMAYLELLAVWSRKMNLTAVPPEHWLRRHVLDSAAVLPFLHGETILDVGTGAGLPGVVLSILAPDKQFCLLDSNLKKQVFLSKVVESVPLNNATCVHDRVEAYQVEAKFSTIVTRAFAPIPKMVAMTSHLLAKRGRFLAMLGKFPDKSMCLSDESFTQKIVSLTVPGENANRHLAIIEGRSADGK